MGQPNRSFFNELDKVHPSLFETPGETRRFSTTRAATPLPSDWKNGTCGWQKKAGAIRPGLSELLKSGSGAHELAQVATLLGSLEFL